MALLVVNKSTLHSATAEELEYVPKILLLRDYADEVGIIWDRLPAHIKADPEVQSYRRCLKHYNLPTQRDHIDGPPPMIRECSECIRLGKRVPFTDRTNNCSTHTYI